MTYQSDTSVQSAVKALLRSLQFSGVKFLRLVSLDVTGNLRAKVKPIDSLLCHPTISLGDQVSIATISCAGLPCYADVMVPGTGLDARDVCKVEPDLNSFRILPYSPKTAAVMGYLTNQYTNESSEYCCKAILRRVIQEAAQNHNIAFVSSKSFPMWHLPDLETATPRALTVKTFLLAIFPYSSDV